MDKIKYRNINMFFKTYGNPKNPPLVLLHGYLESMQVWNNFVKYLMEDLFIITPDLPGHGNSGVYNDIHTMEEMADAIRTLIDELNLKQIHLAGHSMGGYITMAFRELFPERLYSYILINSHCFADSEEKKQNREIEVKMIKAGKKNLIINANIPALFAKNFQDSFPMEIENIKKIAKATPENGIIALLNGMRIRPDRSWLLEKDNLPFMLISGLNDKLIPKNVIEKMEALSSVITKVELSDSGHMGFIEEAEQTAGSLKNFIFNSRTT